jgi:hypothetical protein
MYHEIFQAGLIIISTEDEYRQQWQLFLLGYIGTSVADPDPGSGAFLTPQSGIRDGQKIKIRIRDEQTGSYFRELRTNFLG